MDESPLIEKIKPNSETFINKEDKGSNILPRNGMLRAFKIYYQTTLLIKLVLFLFLFIISMIKLVENFLLIVTSLLKQELTVILLGPTVKPNTLNSIWKLNLTLI